MPSVAADRETRLFEHGFVRLDSAMASDLSVVNSARVSFMAWGGVDDSDAGLIRFLMRDRHGTHPFRHNAFRFHIRPALRRANGSDTYFIVGGRIGGYHELRSFTFRPPRTSARRCRPGAHTFGPVDGPRNTPRRPHGLHWAHVLYGSSSTRRSEGAHAGAADGHVHAVLLDGQRAQPHELPLTAKRGDCAVRDPFATRRRSSRSSPT